MSVHIIDIECCENEQGGVAIVIALDLSQVAAEKLTTGCQNVGERQTRMAK